MIGAATFPDGAPSLDAICEQITAISSLPVVVLESDADELYTLRAKIAFEHMPDNTLSLKVERRGAIARVIHGDTTPEPTTGPQEVHLRLFVGQEPTLMRTTQLALEALGGRPRTPLSDEDRATFGQPIESTELDAREHKLRRQMNGLTGVTCFLLPVLIPMWILAGIWALLTSIGSFVLAVWRLWRRENP